MGKQEFLTQLRKSLSGLPQKDIEERLTFYTEMIEDRMEEGLSEQEAVLAVGTIDEVTADVPHIKRKLKTWEIILLVLGSPIWLSLGIAAVAIILSLYISLWVIVISLWAVFSSLVGCAFGGVIAGIVLTCTGSVLTGVAMVSAALVCVGLSVFLFYGCKAATKGVILLTKEIVVWIKNCFVKKEDA